MRYFLVALAMTASMPVQSSAQDSGTEPVKLSLAQKTALRCSSAFALVSERQRAGAMQQYPALDQRGREFFVRSLASIMAQTGLDRAAVMELIRAEVADLSSDAAIDAVMPPCLTLLDQSGL